MIGHYSSTANLNSFGVRFAQPTDTSYMTTQRQSSGAGTTNRAGIPQYEGLAENQC